MAKKTRQNPIIKNEFMTVYWDPNLNTLRVVASDGQSHVLLKKEINGNGIMAIVRDGAQVAVWGESAISVTVSKK